MGCFYLESVDVGCGACHLIFDLTSAVFGDNGCSVCLPASGFGGAVGTVDLVGYNDCAVKFGD